MKLSEKLKKKLDEHKFSYYEDDEDLDFGKYSPAGQDFHICLKNVDTIEDLHRDAVEYESGYDPSYEASLWLDEWGHGKNGAPYNMGDLYDDMEACLEIIQEFIEILEEVMAEEEEEEEDDD